MSAKPTHVSVDDGAFHKFFHVMPNMYDDDLDPYEYRLLGHYKRTGFCYQSTRTIATKCKMSVGKVSATRKALVEKKLIAVEMLTRKALKERGADIREEKPDDVQKICVVTVVDVTLINHARYAGSVHHMNTDKRSPHEHSLREGQRSLHERKNNPSNKNKPKDSLPSKNGNHRPAQKEKPTHTKAELDAAFDAVKAAWGVENGGVIAQYRGLLFGMGSARGAWKACRLDQPMDVAEFQRFTEWAKRRMAEMPSTEHKMPEVPETIARWAEDFRQQGQKTKQPALRLVQKLPPNFEDLIQANGNFAGGVRETVG